MTSRAPQTTARTAVARVEEIPPGHRKVVEIEGDSVGVFNVDGEYVAVLNVCPHELAPICVGRVQPLVTASVPGQVKVSDEQRILACPWHGWEFDLLTGQCLTDRRRLRRFDTEVEAGVVYVRLG